MSKSSFSAFASISASLAVSAVSALLAGCVSPSIQRNGILQGEEAKSALGYTLPENDAGTRSLDLGKAVGDYVEARLGRSLPAKVRVAHDQAARIALWQYKTHRKRAWLDVETGTSGTIQASSPRFIDEGGATCRRFHDEITEDGRPTIGINGSICLYVAGWVVAY